MLQYLRIAVTALSLTACALLVALWVRSYQRCDHLAGPLSSTRLVHLVSCRGLLYVGTAPIEYLSHFGTRGAWKWKSGPSENMPSLTQRMKSFLGVYWHRRPLERENQFVVPIWMVTLVCGAITGVVTLRRSRRFSLRTLLITTTLVAVGLGIVVLLS